MKVRAKACALAGLVALVTAASTAAAHIGSPDTWFEGKAGPYPIRVVVRAPGVVPGLAEIHVRVLEGAARRVTAQPWAWDARAGGAPPPDVARPVPGDSQLYSVNLWLMAAGSYGVHVHVSGDRGWGMAVVPVQAVATRRLPMDRGLTAVLIALALFLLAGLVTIAGAAVRDGVLPPGEYADARGIRRSRLAMATSAVLLGLGLFGGRAWWDRVDRAYAEGIYKPFHAVASVVDSAGAPWVRFAIDDPRWRGRGWTPLLPDHDKLMHLFLVRTPDLGAIAHLHPLPRDSASFEAALPAIPAGHYRVYGDIVHESGFAQTLTTEVEVRGGAESAGVSATDPRSDPDDSWFAGSTVADSAAEPAFTLDDGAVITWDRGPKPLVAAQERPLLFRATEPDGSPATLEPYLGMVAHAIVTRADGEVFAHLHPIGTVSMASQMALTMRTPADSIPGSLGRRMSENAWHERHIPAPAGDGGAFSIPYAFPRSGRYRIWVQVRHRGAVRTAAFDATVAPAEAHASRR